MRKTFVIVSVSNRVNELNKLTAMIRSIRRFDDYDICLHFQDPDDVRDAIVDLNAYRYLLLSDELQGCHGARVNLLRKLADHGYTGYVNLDDDMMVTTYTDYEPALSFAQMEGTGFVMTNWARTYDMLLKKVPKMVEARAAGMGRFKRQIMLYNGGGMCYGEHVAKLMRKLEPVKTAFDCAWPITTYVNGYMNYRDQGSLAVHAVCTTGGMNTFMGATPLHTMCQDWLEFEPTKKQDGTCMSVKIPLDKHVKRAAKILHQRRAKAYV